MNETITPAEPVVLTCGEGVRAGVPAEPPALSTVYAARGDDGVIRVYLGRRRRVSTLLELGVPHEDPAWVAGWLEALAGAVRSVDR